MSKKLIVSVLAALMTLTVMAVGAVWAFPVLRVADYEVTGNDRISDEVVQEATGVVVGENMMRIDIVDAAAGVAGLPWVRSVTVSRRWPDTLGVEVIERQAVLYADEPDGALLIDGAGTPFLIDVPPETAVEITGAGSDETDVLSEVAEVVGSLPEYVLEQVARVDAPSAPDIQFHLHDGRTVYWGANENNHDKALAMETVLTRTGQHWNISAPTMVTVR